MGILKKIILTVVAIITLQACYTKSGCPVLCDETRPATGELTVRVTRQTENPVYLTVYEGKKDPNGTNKVVITDTLFDVDERVYIVPFATYTAEAKYKIGNKTYIAIDYDKVKLKEKTYDDCDKTCYDVNNGYINLELLD